MTIKEQLLQLTRQLFPTGRAFRIPYGSIKESIEKAYIESEARAYNDAMSILDTILPDNDNFTAEDATRWEQRLGMITNESVSLEDRKSAIKRKMNHPGDILARQSWDYIQNSLQAAGFNVWIHPNLNGESPENILILPLDLGEMGEPEMGEIEMGDAYSYFPEFFTAFEMGEPEMGEIEMGGYQYNLLVANGITQAEDAYFGIGDNYKCTFFVGGETLGTFASVPQNRELEFRQLLLKLKPAKTVGILFINYT
jgi:hypothetical protein